MFGGGSLVSIGFSTSFHLGVSVWESSYLVSLVLLMARWSRVYLPLPGALHLGVSEFHSLFFNALFLHVL